MTADVANVGPAVVGGVAVENLFVEAGAGDADDVAFADDRSGVHDHYDEVVVVFFSVPDERENAVVAVIAIDPFEALPVEIDFVKSGLHSEDVVEISDEFLDATMGIPLQ